MADFRDATFAQSGPNSRFLRDFLAQNGFFVQDFVRIIHFLEQSDEKFRGRNAKFRAPEFFFRGLEFYFRGPDEKIPVRKRFRGGSGGVFPSRWNFFPDTFPVSFCRWNPPTGFPDSRASAPGVSRVPSKGQAWRGFRDILIPAWRVWLRSFRAVPVRRPNTRISEAKMSKLSTRTRMCSFCQWKDVRRGCISFRSEIRIMGTVPNLGDLTTDEYSFVIKCPDSRHLPVLSKTPPPCRGGGSKSRRGFPPCHSARGGQNGHYGRRKGNKRALWPPHGEQKGRYAPVGVSPLPPLRDSSSCEAGQFIPASFDCRHSEVCKSRNSVSLNSPNSFFQMVLNPQECGMFLNICNKYRLPLQKARNLAGKLSFPAQILCSPVSFIFQGAGYTFFSHKNNFISGLGGDFTPPQ